MENTAEQNRANDYKVVSFHNSESFDFTHAMGCMYDGRPITGVEGVLGIKAGETKMLPYHVGFQLAKNLAKQALISRANVQPEKDALGNPMPLKAIWDDEALATKQRGYITEMYSEDKPAAQSQTDILFDRIAKLEALIKDKPEESAPVVVPPTPEDTLQAPADLATVTLPKEDVVSGYKDKQEVIKELEKRNIPHNKRDSQAKLEELLK